MRHILIYGYSLSWGIIHMTRKRLPFESRWPAVLEGALYSRGAPVRVTEDCLNGRRTVWDDPFKPGRNGLEGLSAKIEVHSPLALVMIMLGTNDFQSMHPHNAWHSAQGIAALVSAIRRAPIEPEMPVPSILIIAPPSIQNPKGPLAEKFLGAEAKCAGLADAYREVAFSLKCHFFDSSTVTQASHDDGIHLDQHQHFELGQALADVVAGIVGPSA